MRADGFIEFFLDINSIRCHLKYKKTYLCQFNSLFAGLSKRMVNDILNIKQESCNVWLCTLVEN